MSVCVFNQFFDPLPIKLFQIEITGKKSTDLNSLGQVGGNKTICKVIEQEKKNTSSMTYPYPKGEHMAVGVQINELQLLEEFKELTIENQLIDFFVIRAHF